MPIPRFHLADSALLLVDMQEKLVPHMHNSAALVPQVGRLLDGANALKLPVLVTEQYRPGLGTTIAPLAGRLGQALCNEEKLKFSACIEPVRALLTTRGIRNVLLCGIEAHVCVLQSALDLMEEGYVVGLAVDAIGARRAADQEAAVRRMVQAGVVPTTVESFLLELVHEAGGDRFKAILPLIR